ncbi:MAG TPA: asparagine synthase (glutamine-hydrolyzing) [Candidatus Paceibacterota bacterium]
MCGIFGFTGSDQALGGALGASLSHRGPDDEGIETESGVTLGNRRLSIIDLSARGHQPMWWNNRAIGIVYNGEIYNHKELRKELEAEGARFASDSDTEVLLVGYARHGLSFFSKARGMWACAFFHPKEQKLVLVRDYYGIKPLYVLKAGREIAFASEMKALGEFARARNIPLSLSEDGLASFFTFGYAMHPHTIFNEIKKVEPGTAHTISLQSGESSVEHLPRPIVITPESFDDAIQDSVERHLVSDVPVGIFLSGGLDSTAIALALQKLGHPLSAYTLEIEGRKDAEYAKRIASYTGLSHKSFSFTQERFEDVYRRIWNSVDDAVADSALFTNFAIAEEAAKDVKVVLAGEGGDEMFFGYERYRALQKLRHVWRVRGLWQHFGLQSVAHTDAYMRLIRPIARRVRLAESWLSGDLLSGYADMASIGGDMGDRVKALKTLRTNVRPTRSNMEYQMSFFDQAYYLPDDLLYKTDITTMAHSIEARVPFLDAGMEAYARATQTGYDGKKQPRDYLARPVRGIASNGASTLPSDLILKEKVGFSIPIRRYVYERHRQDIQESISALLKLNVPGISHKALLRMRDNPSYYEAVEKYLPQLPFACLVLARVLARYQIKH